MRPMAVRTKAGMCSVMMSPVERSRMRRPVSTLVVL